IDSSLVLEQIQAKLVLKRLGFPYWRKGAFPEDVTDGRVGFIHVHHLFLSAEDVVWDRDIADAFAVAQTTFSARSAYGPAEGTLEATKFS
ncbi:MAG: hypothetical protein Q3X94_06195, partial [Oscillospiraceae bacterium]|nr:hypothetical protein [Oscillospiraceae bacterium]